MSEGVVIVTGACPQCGLPTGAAASNSPCPYCGHPAPERSGVELHAMLYGMPLASLQRLKLSLHSAQPVDEPLTTIVDVLLALYVIAEETAPPDQLDEVISNVSTGRLDRLPLPRRGPCFCDSGKRYGKCHGRA